MTIRAKHSSKFSGPSRNDVLTETIFIKDFFCNHILEFVENLFQP